MKLVINHHILNNYKIGTLSDRLWRTFVEICLVFSWKEELVTSEDLAFYTHKSLENIERDVAELEKLGLLDDFKGVRRRIGYVYLIKDCERNLYKIGMTTDIRKRLNALQSSTGNSSLMLIHKIRSKRCSELEKILHQMFAGKCVFGEWFQLTDEDVDWIKSIEETDLINPFLL